MKNNLTRWDKFEKGLDNFGNSFNAAFDNFFRPMYDGDMMRTDVKENDKEYVLEIEVPGYDKKDISVDVNDGYLTVSAKKEEKSEDEKHGYILDPHGACGYRALEHQLEPGETGVFLETAHPAKFNSVINDVIKTEVEIPERLAAFMKGKKQSIEIGNRFEDLKKFLMTDK